MDTRDNTPRDWSARTANFVAVTTPVPSRVVDPTEHVKARIEKATNRSQARYEYRLLLSR